MSKKPHLQDTPRHSFMAGDTKKEIELIQKISAHICEELEASIKRKEITPVGACRVIVGLALVLGTSEEVHGCPCGVAESIEFISEEDSPSAVH